MKMRAMQVTAPGGAFELVERNIPEPERDQVRIKVEACGICHSDVLTKEGHWPGIQYPRIPGHEVAGVIDEIGPGVVGWTKGQRVGIGWHGGRCGYCSSCRRGDFVTCQVAHLVTGINFDGGYANYMIAHPGTLAEIPDDLTFTDAAPLMCAGVTTFNSLRNSGAKPGDLVAVLGVGGLGHLGVQFAAKMGFKTVAIARGADKKSFVHDLGAGEYIDSEKQDPGAELAKLGGAVVVLATVTNAKAMTATLSGLAINGKLIVLGAPSEPLEVPSLVLIAGRRSVSGWPSGSAIDSEDTLRFCAQTGIRPMTELFSLEQAQQAYDRMLSGKVRFRAVLKI